MPRSAYSTARATGVPRQQGYAVQMWHEILTCKELGLEGFWYVIQLQVDCGHDLVDALRWVGGEEPHLPFATIGSKELETQPLTFFVLQELELDAPAKPCLLVTRDELSLLRSHKYSCGSAFDHHVGPGRFQSK